MGAAFFALGQALVDAVAIGLVGDDENAALGGRCRRGEEERRGQKRCCGSHAAPVNQGVTPFDRPKTLTMINHARRGGLMAEI
jgi:hypothetical protein